MQNQLFKLKHAARLDDFFCVCLARANRPVLIRIISPERWLIVKADAQVVAEQMIVCSISTLHCLGG